MTARHPLSALVGIAITLGTTRVTAGQDIAPYYDEDTDTIVYRHVGHQATRRTAMMGAP